MKPQKFRKRFILSYLSIYKVQLAWIDSLIFKLTNADYLTLGAKGLLLSLEM